MIKIAHVSELELIRELPASVIKVVEETVEILDAEYGVNRDMDNGYGGYVLVLESERDLDELQEHRVDIAAVIFEYTDEILCADGQVYVSALVLQGSDNGILLVMTLELYTANFI